jgi:hypothetical protein
MATDAGVLGVGANWFSAGYEKGFLLGDGRLFLNGKTVTPLTIAKTDVTAPASTDGNVFSGTYTPTITDVTNVTSSAADVNQYVRVGKTVTVSGLVTVTPTAASGAITNIRISLPISSNIGSSTECCGTATAVDSTAARSTFAKIIGDAANDTAEMQFNANTTLANIFYYSFTYLVK